MFVISPELPSITLVLTLCSMENELFDCPDYFSDEEFAAVGCSRADVDAISLARLNRCRRLCGFPFILTSAYRSPHHEVCKGRPANGPHTTGQAFDIACDSNLKRFKIVEAAITVGFKRIGIGKNFIHLDDCTDKPNPRIWTYYN